MDLSRTLQAFSDSLALDPVFIPLALIAAIAAFALRCQRRSAAAPPFAAVSTTIPILPDPDPYEGFELKTAKTRDHVYVNKVRTSLVVRLTQWLLTAPNADNSVPILPDDGSSAHGNQ